MVAAVLFLLLIAVLFGFGLALKLLIGATMAWGMMWIIVNAVREARRSGSSR